MKLKDEYIQKVRNNIELRLKICEAHGNIAESTVMRWLRENHPMLAHKISAMVISQFFSVSEDDLYILEEHDFKIVK